MCSVKDPNRMLIVKGHFNLRNNFQVMLHHQPWRERFSLDFDESDGFSPSELEVISQQVMNSSLSSSVT